MDASTQTHKQTVKEQSADDGGETQRHGLVGFHEPIVVNRARDSADVDQAMKHLPPFAAQTADHSAGRSDGKRDHKQECRESGGDKRPLIDIVDHLGEVERFIQPNISCEVQTTKEESEQAEHPAETN